MSCPRGWAESAEDPSMPELGKGMPMQRENEAISFCACHSCSVFLRNYKLLGGKGASLSACSRLLGFMLNKWFLMRKLQFPLMIIGPVHYLSHCQTQLVELCVFSLKALQAVRKFKVRGRTQCLECKKLMGFAEWWDPLALRKIESSFLLSNLKFIETSGQQTEEKLFPKHYAFRFPISLKKYSLSARDRRRWTPLVNGIGERSHPA